MRIKIACPHDTVTGGIELLHQVAAELNKYDGVTAEIWYMYNTNVTAIPDDYLMYGNTVNNAIADDDILMFPEIWSYCTHNPRYADQQKIVYWESVDNYFPHTEKHEWFKFGKNTLHISQTEYSNRFLRDVVKTKDVIEITDYVNDEYLDCDITGKRKPVVLYNPLKGMDFTEKVIQLAEGVTFIPITGMARSEILELMTSSMVWIDFGNFPGKDRLPREAGACGMCLITGKRGSAKYHKDMGIPDVYKIDNANYADVGNVVDLIHDLIDNFDERQKLYSTYRKRLKQERKQFREGIKALVDKLS